MCMICMLSAGDRTLVSYITRTVTKLSIHTSILTETQAVEYPFYCANFLNGGWFGNTNIVLHILPVETKKGTLHRKWLDNLTILV